jgi:transmembrane sensor
LIRLPDGTRADLNTDSRLSWRFTSRTRRVWLERGEAALEVSRDNQARPFLVNGEQSEVELAQGVFNARLRRSGLEVVVMSGEAAAGGASPAVVGESLLVGREGFTRRQLTPAAMDAAAAWRRGEIIFNGDTLGAAVAEYNRYLTAKIEIADPDVAELRLGGRFMTRDPSAFLESVRTAFGVRVETADDGAVTLHGG